MLEEQEHPAFNASNIFPKSGAWRKVASDAEPPSSTSISALNRNVGNWKTKTIISVAQPTGQLSLLVVACTKQWLNSIAQTTSVINGICWTRKHTYINDDGASQMLVFGSVRNSWGVSVRVLLFKGKRGSVASKSDMEPMEMANVQFKDQSPNFNQTSSHDTSHHETNVYVSWLRLPRPVWP